MSVPYSGPPQQPGMPGQPAAGLNVGLILRIAVAALGLITYFCAFSQEFSGRGLTSFVEYLLAGAALAGASLLPKAGRGILVASVVLSVVPALTLLQLVINSTGSVPSIFVVVVIAAILQAAAAVVALLFDAEIIKMQPKPVPYGMPGGYGGFPQPPYGQQMGAYGQPAQGQGGYGHPGQQPVQGQPGQGQPGQGQPGGQPGQGQPGGYGQPQQPQQGQFGGQQSPGTPPGGVGSA